jgi:phospho-N-acetylmuramoyl-pentapeptide-transferase
MFQLLYDAFGSDHSSLRIFNYVTFRAMMAGLTSMIFSFWIGPKVISYLVSLKFKESVRTDGPSTHASKSGTPTMGGLLILISFLISLLFWANWKNQTLILLVLITSSFSLLGFIDDYMKSVKKIKGGMRARTKFVTTIFLSLLFVYFFYFQTGSSDPNTLKGMTYELTDLFVPFIKGPFLALGLFAIPFGILVIIGTSHAVNLTDGLDGLAAGCVAIATTTLGIISYVSGTPIAAHYLNIPYLPGSHEYSVLLSALTGSLIGFLWFNANPAQVFMGDTGSLFLGSTLGMVAIVLKKEILLIILGGLFVAEALSVILQVSSFKLTGKRIFKMAPLHHHFELEGMKEVKIVTRFWIIGIILAILSLSTLKIQ